MTPSRVKRRRPVALVDPPRGSLVEAWDEIRRLRADLDRLKVSFGNSPRLMAGQFTCPNVNGTDQVITDLDFFPRCGWFMVAPAPNADALHMGVGFAADTVDGVFQFSMSVRGTEAGPNMSRNRNNSDAISIADVAGSHSLRGQITSFDPAGITIDFIVANNAYDVYWMLMG